MLKAVINASETENNVKVRIEIKMPEVATELTPEEDRELLKTLSRRVANALLNLPYTDFGPEGIAITFDK